MYFSSTKLIPKLGFLDVRRWSNINPTVINRVACITRPIKFFVGLPSTTLAQHWANIGRISNNPNAAELFRTIFHSFEAGIANAISSSKWRKVMIFMSKWTFSNVYVRLTKHLPQDILKNWFEFIWSDICLKTHIYNIIRFQWHKGY